MTDIIARIIPIILLISLGQYLRYKEFFHQKTIDEIKNVVINIALSAVLFIAFFNMDLMAEYFLVFIIIFLVLIIFFLIGLALNNYQQFHHPLMPFITSGFSFGFLGIPLFTTVFGIENLGMLSIIGVGHEFFIWILFYPAMRMRFKNEKFSVGMAKDILFSPLMISIALGMFFNIADLGDWIQGNAIPNGFYVTVQYLADLATPLMLIIIGFGLRFNKRYMKQSIKFYIIRMMIILTIGYATKYLIIDRIMPSSEMFNYAYFTFLILPPPLSLSIFVGSYSSKENEELANNTVVLSTVMSIAIFILFMLFL
ncbi:AEC family transporter [Natronincola peptidivorans]|nr:malate permease [Natronincola peptidivorans]